MSLGSSANTFEIKADGGLVRAKTNGNALLDIPTSVSDKTVRAVSSYANKAAAVTSEGDVHVWGDTRNVQAGVFSVATLGAKAIDVEMSSTYGVVLLETGDVVMLTSFVPAHETVTLVEDAVQVAVAGPVAFARLRDGGIVAFNTQWSTVGLLTTVPAAVAGDTISDPVVSFDAPGVAGLVVAATQSGDVYTWTASTGAMDPSDAYPAEGVNGDPVLVATTGANLAAVTDEDEVVVWGTAGSAATPVGIAMRTVPETVQGKNVVALEGTSGAFAAVVAPPLPPLTETSAPTITGNTAVGSTLTATEAVFAGSPDSVSNVWFADDAPIEDLPTEGAASTTLALTSAHLGKEIAFQSTAHRGEDEPVVSTKVVAGTVTAAPDPGPSPSATAVSAAAGTYGTAATVTVRVGNTAGRPVAGTVSLAGAGAPQTAAVAGGVATFQLDRALAAGAYTLTASYSGSSALTASSGALGLTVNKAKGKKPVFKATKASTSKKKGKATVTVGSNSGLAKATGKATVTLKKGKTTKKISVKLSGGKRSISLPKLKKGTWKVQVSYNGDSNYVAQKSKSYNLKIKK